MSSVKSRLFLLFFLAFGLALCTAHAATLGQAATAPAHKPGPIYIHMNGANMFLENVAAVRPGKDVVFVDQDTGAHAVVGYNPLTGEPSPRFDGALEGTPGRGTN